MAMMDIKKFYKYFSHLSKRERLVFYAAVAVISLTMIDRLILNPVISRMKMLDEQINQEEILIKRDLHILSQKERIIQESKRYQKYSAKDLSTEEITTSLLKEIGDLANKSSVYLIDIKPSGIKEESAYRNYFVNLSCEAQMEQVNNFIFDIENSDNLLKVDSFNITPKAENSSIARCSMVISKTVIP